MKKFLILTFLFFGLNLSVAQTWTKTFDMNDGPDYVKEDTSGNLEVYYENNTSSFKLIISSEGDSLGIEPFSTPPDQHYFDFILTTESSGLVHKDSVAYFDLNDSLIWKADFDPAYIDWGLTEMEYSDENFAAVTDYRYEGNNCNVESFTLYNRLGQLIYFNEYNPNCEHEFTTFSHRMDRIWVRGEFWEAWAPLGSFDAEFIHHVVDSQGTILCSDVTTIMGYVSNRIMGNDINGVGKCGAVRRHGSNSPTIQVTPVQYLPCSDYPIPMANAVADQKGVYGLETDAFAVLGYVDGKTHLTRIDCDEPYETLCLYEHEINLNETLCMGDVYELGNETFSEPGEYVIQLIDSNGCDSIYYLSLELENFIPTIDPIFLPDNMQMSVNLNSNCSDCLFIWNTGETGSTIDELDPGTYTVTLITANECSFDFIVEVPIISSTPNFLNYIPTFKNILSPNEKIWIQLNIPNAFSQINIINSQGILTQSKILSEQVTILLESPSMPGVYFAEFLDYDGKRVGITKLIVIE